jgi:hypothetical protein
LYKACIRAIAGTRRSASAALEMVRRISKVFSHSFRNPSLRNGGRLKAYFLLPQGNNHQIGPKPKPCSHLLSHAPFSAITMISTSRQSPLANRGKFGNFPQPFEVIIIDYPKSGIK